MAEETVKPKKAKAKPKAEPAPVAGDAAPAPKASKAGLPKELPEVGSAARKALVLCGLLKE